MFVDWLAAGINPTRATIFIQSRVPEHAELTLLLGMITPVGWLERVPTYKDQQQKLADRDLSNYGFLGYPVMQGADILIYRANMVPVGEDQVSHIELVRELARRFNHIYGREPGFEDKAKAAVKKLGAKKARRYGELRTAFQEQGDDAALEAAQATAERDAEPVARRPRAAVRLSRGLAARDPARAGSAADRDAEGAGPRRPEDVEVARQHDPDARGAGRGHEEDPHDADRSGARAPLRQGRSRTAARCGRCTRSTPTRATRDWVVKGCTTAGIGCLDCKQPVIDAIIREQEPIRERAQRYLDDPQLVRNIVADGCERARKLAEETMRDVRGAMGLDYT